MLRGTSAPREDDPATSDDDGEWEEWAEEEDMPTVCLFSSRVFASAAECLSHAASEYALDLPRVVRDHRLDLYGRVKLVNFVRASVIAGASPADVLAAVGGAEAPRPWEDEKYLVPVLPDDPLLYSLSAAAAGGARGASGVGVAAEAEKMEEEEEEEEEAAIAAAALHETVAQMRREMSELLSGLEDKPAEAAREAAVVEAPAVKRGRGGGRGSNPAVGSYRVLGEEVREPPPPPEAAARSPPSEGGVRGAAAEGGREEEEKEAEEGEEEEKEEGRRMSALLESVGYFSTYARVRIHQEMLADRVRTDGYRAAIERNRSAFEGKVVLDVGCGTGILSLFAARAGARLVIGVEASDIIHHARSVVEANGLQGKIVLLHGEMEETCLPEGIEKVDVILSEWMGYACVFESMLSSVIDARDRFLAHGGCVLPTSCPMYVTASSHDTLAFWDTVQGFNMRAIAEEARKEVSVELVPAEAMLSRPALFRCIDCTTCKDSELDFTSYFQLQVSVEGMLRCLVIHFDTVFDLSGGERVEFSTASEAPPTHWKQTALYLNKPQHVQAGAVIEGHLILNRDYSYPRAYNISVTFSLGGEQCDTQTWRMR
ncbi:hypothetical protein AB1Y20_013411 [Prymnesium parvum]|uniref:type I protein arginine methyltransferase n=1 Tax=Prymnesium parvum TaxID=97485 RepID=A0AB34IIM5_PRYPA